MADFLNESGEILKHGVLLPHWQQGEVMQFVTFRLGDAMPATKLRQWKEELITWREHHAWVIMPNHLHLIFTPMNPLETLLKA